MTIHPAAKHLLIEAARVGALAMAQRTTKALHDSMSPNAVGPLANAYEQWRAAGRPHLTDEESIRAGVPLERRQAFTGPGFEALLGCDDGLDNGRNTCTREPVWRCACGKCTRHAVDGGQFHACSEHVGEAKAKHERLYPKHSPDFRHIEEKRT